MKRIYKPFYLGIIAALFGLSACGDDDGGDLPAVEPLTFRVTIENTNSADPYFQSGIFNTPDGAAAPGPVLPGSGDTYSFTIEAGRAYLPGATPRINFLTMLVASNDLFIAPGENGIPLYDENGVALSGDITGEFYLWDAGTEVNRTPGSMDQPGPGNDPAGSGTDENGLVTLLGGTGSEIPVMIVTDNGIETFNYPAVDQLVRISVINSGTTFTFSIENLSGSTDVPSPLSPGGYVVHIGDQILFADGEAERGNGIEEIAEDGITDTFNSHIEGLTSLITPFSPGVYIVHESGMPLFTDGQPDYGEGLEAIAEDGDPSILASSLANNGDLKSFGTYGSAPIGPGGMYEFEFEAAPGDRLSWTTMFVQSNDWIYTFDDDGIALFTGNIPVSGDITSMIELYDVGTEEDMFPGAGTDQAIRQAGPDTGNDDSNPAVREVTDASGIVPEPFATIRVTITPLN